jgi:unsaturated chondroitin disaccharide hydrolase
VLPAMHIDRHRTYRDLVSRVDRMFELSAAKIRSLEETWQEELGAPVFTVDGRYQSRGWTEWTQGFQFGSAILQFDATGDREFLELGRTRTLERMAPHLTHLGVHDHGFNNVSTYGALWRLRGEDRLDAPEWEVHFYELALKVSGAIQASRWTRLPDAGLHPFVQRRAFALRRYDPFPPRPRARPSPGPSPVGRTGRPHQPAGAAPAARPRDGAACRLLRHRTRPLRRPRTGRAREPVQRRQRDVPGPSSQQGYSPFSTWTRGLAWAMLGFAEQLEFLAAVDDDDLGQFGGRAAIDAWMLDAARATCDCYVDDATASDGVPYWDTGAPGLAALGDWTGRPADPFNDHEPVDSSAAAIAAQGLIRLGRVLAARGDDGSRYEQAGLRVLDTLVDDAGPYLSTDPAHQGLLLHSIYHRPNGWDHVPSGSRIPRGESSQWGDYHLREAALLVRRLAREETYLTFFR